MNADIHLEHGAGSSQGKHEGEPSLALCDRLNRTRDNSQRQLPTDHDYAVSTREYQTDQSSLKNCSDCCSLCLRERKATTTTTPLLRGVDTVTPYQGNSLLVVTPEGKTLLVDAGGIAGASPDSKFDTGEDVVSQVLWTRGIQRLDAVAITHAHADHIGGMPAVLRNFHPRELWIGRNPDSPAYDRLIRQAETLGIGMREHAAGDIFRFGSTEIRVLSPAPGYLPKNTPGNDDSLVLRVTYGNTSALLEGDAEASSEAHMVALGGLRSDLLKVGHHGSKTSTTPGFLKAVEPSYAAISVGQHNYYGHPKLETLEKLEAAHAHTYRTDLLGASTFYLDGKHVTASGWNQLSSP